MSSYREMALTDLAARLAYIQTANGYNSDAGANIFMGEAPRFGPDDPPAALAIVIRDDQPAQVGAQIETTVPVEVQALVPADLSAPLLAIEAIITDIKRAVEIEGRHQNAAMDPSVQRALEGTLPTGLGRGVTRALPREEGTAYVGASVEYLLAFKERWGFPGPYEEEDT